MPKVSLKAIISGISLVSSPLGGKVIKMDMVEEHEVPSPIIVREGEASGLVKEVVPVITQILRSMPFGAKGKFELPRLTLWLTEEEWDRLTEGFNIGEEVIIEVEERKVKISKK